MSLSSACRRLRWTMHSGTATACMAIACMIGHPIPGAGPASAAAAERDVLAVIALDSYGDIRRQLGWLGGQVGQPALAGMLESVLMLASQGRGLAGLDAKRPIGVVVTTDGSDMGVQGFVPVKSLDTLLEALQGVTGPVQRSGDTRSIMLPSGVLIDLVERNGWAIVSPRGGGGDTVDPEPLLDRLSKTFTLGIELFPSRLPEPLRRQLRMVLEQSAAASAGQGVTIDPQAMAASLDGLSSIESLLFGIAIDPDKDRLFVENRTVAVPGTPGAAALQGSDTAALTVPLPPAADGGRHAMRGYFIQSVPDAVREEAMALLDQALPPGSEDPLTKTLATLLREVLRSVLETGGIDAAASVDTSAAAAETPLPAITAGLRVRDGAALEASVKRAFDPQGEAAKRVDISFDTAKVATANLHTIRVDLDGSEAAERLGPSIELTLAVTPTHAFLLAGGDPRKRLATALDAAAQADPQAKPLAGLDLAVDRVLEYFAIPTAPGAGLDGGRGADAADATGGQVRLLVRPIERGVATRLAIDGAGLRTAATAAAAMGGAAGPVVPPGLPIPNGFPIPAPAR